MLRIRFDNNALKDRGLPNCDKVAYYVSDWFDTNYLDEWFSEDDEFIKKIVRVIDKSELIGQCVLSPVLGSISLRDLSGGAKTCICIYKEQNNEGVIFDAGSCGNNCSPILEEIGKRIDVEVNFSHLHYNFSENFEFICVNDGSHVSGYQNYLLKMYEFMMGSDNDENDEQL